MRHFQVLPTCFNLGRSQRQQVSKMEEVFRAQDDLLPGSTVGGRSCFRRREGLTEEEQEVSRGLEEELELLKLLDWPSAGDIKCGTCERVFDTKKLLYFH